jgi:hypothetical protein
MKAGATKGMDLVVLLAGLMLLAVICSSAVKSGDASFRPGCCPSFCMRPSADYGRDNERLFLLYVLQFGSSLFAFLLSLQAVAAEEVYRKPICKASGRTGVFLIAGAVSTFIWLTFFCPL